VIRLRNSSLVILLFLASISFPLIGLAQESIHLESLRVDIWPEFDRPAVLIIYHIRLSADTTLPTTFQLRIPVQATVHAVAVLDPELGLFITEYDRTVVNEWAVLDISANMYDVQVEFYDALQKDGITRQVAYTWPGDLGVDAFSVLFQNPVGAENLILDPLPESSLIDQYSLLNYLSGTIALAEGETFTLTASYEKTSDELSVSSMVVEPSTPLDETSGQVLWNDVLPWILGGLGVVLIAMGLMVLFGFRPDSNKRIRKLKRRPRLNGEKTKKAKESDGSQALYCKECGRRAKPGDRYCRSCGIRIQPEG